MAIDPNALAALMGSGGPSAVPQSPMAGLGSLLGPGLMGAGANLARTGMALMRAGGPQQLPGGVPHPPMMPGGGQRMPMTPGVPGATPPFQPPPALPGAPGAPAAPQGMGAAGGGPLQNPLVMALLRARLAQGGGMGGMGF